MSKHFEISGYWLDDKSEFDGLIVREFDDEHPDEDKDEQIFYYGLSERDLKEAVEEGEDTMGEFVITSYQEIDF